MSDTLTIELRGQTYKADSPTQYEALILASLFLPGNTESERIVALQNAENASDLMGFDLNDPTQAIGLTATVMVRLQNPATVARIARTVKTLFPDLPDSLVNHRLVQTQDDRFEHDYRWKLEDSELLSIIKSVLDWLTAAAQPQPEPAKGFQPASRKRKSRAIVLN